MSKLASADFVVDPPKKLFQVAHSNIAHVRYPESLLFKLAVIVPEDLNTGPRSALIRLFLAFPYEIL